LLVLPFAGVSNNA